MPLGHEVTGETRRWQSGRVVAVSRVSVMPVAPSPSRHPLDALASRTPLFVLIAIALRLGTSLTA